VRVHLAAEHALQLEAADFALEPLGVPPDVLGGRLIALPLGQFQELRRVGDALGRAVDLRDVGAEAGALLPELLRPLRLRPDGRVLQLPPYLLEALLLAIVLKETPGARLCARLGL
jgi:hypothetical protein